MRDINVLDTPILCQNTQRRHISGKLVISVAKVGVLLILQLEHGGELGFHLVLDFRIEFIEEGRIVGGLLTQNEEGGTLDVVTLFECRICLGGNCLGGSYTQSCGPENKG
jgi:hypothetical protein